MYRNIVLPQQLLSFPFIFTSWAFNRYISAMVCCCIAGQAKCGGRLQLKWDMERASTLRHSILVLLILRDIVQVPFLPQNPQVSSWIASMFFKRCQATCWRMNLLSQVLLHLEENRHLKVSIFLFSEESFSTKNVDKVGQISFLPLLEEYGSCGIGYTVGIESKAAFKPPLPFNSSSSKIVTKVSRVV